MLNILITNPKDAFYQIWLKSVKWIWRRRLKEKFTEDDRRDMITIAHFRLWLR